MTVTNTAQTLRLEEISSAVSYVGGWNHGNTARPWSGGTATLGFAAGHRATLSFTGTGVSWIGFKGSFAGIANVYLDGPLVATVDSYAAAETVQAVLYHDQRADIGAAHPDDRGDRHEERGVGRQHRRGGRVRHHGRPFRQHAAHGDNHDANSRDDRVWRRPVTANATDNIGVAGVRFFVDGAQIGAEDTVSPYSISWDTTTVTDGSHTLTAAARDGAGQHHDICGSDRHGVQRVSATDCDGDAHRGDGSVDYLHAGDAGSRAAG